MTKEPIMIDDVDVSECEFVCHYTKDRTYCNATDSLCKEETTCYYKQLKRKEQEYNRLSNLITSTKTYEITCLNCRDAILTAPTISGRTKFSQIEVEEISLKMIIKQLKDKEQECDQLKAENKKLKELVKTRIEDLCDSCGASSMFPMPCKVYEQDLQEIKGIVFELKKIVKSYKFDKYTSKILQKCEVIDA